jgi:type IV pilus assembly protein PilB
MVAAPSDIRRAIRAYYGGVSGAPFAAASQPALVVVVEVSALRPAVKPVAPPPLPVPVVAPAAAPPAPVELAPDHAAPPHVAASAPQAAPASVASAGTASRASIAPARPRMISITLLDGTSVALPAPADRRHADAAPDAPATAEDALTAADLVAALRARSSGADVSAVLGEATWESMFAALLSVLLRKHLIADWEFVEAWQEHRR